MGGAHSYKKRLRTLLQAKKLGSVAMACREAGISRSTFYEWKERIEENGHDGLAPMPSSLRAHPQTTGKDAQEQIKSLALAHPTLGCAKLRDLLPKESRVSAVTIQKILNRSGIGRRADRWIALERIAASKEQALSEEQRKFIQIMNPCFSKCDIANQGPGWALVAGVWKIRIDNFPQDMLLVAVLDTWTGYAFGVVTSEEKRTKNIKILNSQITRFYQGWGRRAQAIQVPGTLNAERDRILSYEDESSLIKWLFYPSVLKKKQPICCLQRFQRIASQEYFRRITSEGMGDDVEYFDKSFQKWLTFYNVERKHHGFPYNSRAPFDKFNRQLKRPPEKPKSKGYTQKVKDSDPAEASDWKASKRSCRLLVAFIEGKIPNISLRPRNPDDEYDAFSRGLCHRRKTASRHDRGE